MRRAKPVSSPGKRALVATEGLLILLLVVGAVRALAAPPEDQSGRRALLQYAFLITALSALSRLHVAGLDF